jgi:hypothetical protein
MFEPVLTAGIIGSVSANNYILLPVRRAGFGVEHCTVDVEDHPRCAVAHRIAQSIGLLSCGVMVELRS